MEEVVFILFIAVVVLVVTVIKLKGQNADLTLRINRLEYQQKDLFGKAFYNYQQIKGINHNLGFSEKDNMKIAETIRTPIVNGRDRYAEKLSHIEPVVSTQPVRAPMGNVGNVGNVNVSEKQSGSVNPYQQPDNNIPVQNAATVNTGVNIAKQPVENVPVQNAATVNTGVNIAKQAAENVPVQNAATVNTSVNIAKQAAENVPVQNTATVKTGVNIAKQPVNNVPVQNRVNNNINPYTGKPFVNMQNRQTAPVQRQASVPPKPVKKAPSMSVERWLGTHLFNIVASLMIFIGLILFCTLGYEYITDGMKIAAMHLVSLSFVGIGGYLTKKNRSVFSLGLTGCGMGSFFIAILLTHIYFHAINDIIAFSLLLVWIILALFLSKKLNSLMLSITAHIGMAISVCFAFSLGFSADKIILPIIYQLASIAVIIIGNIICYKKTYRFGLFLSMGLLVYSSGVIAYVFGKSGVVPFEVSVMLASIVFAVQFIAISFVSYLISVSCNILENNKDRHFEDSPVFIHILNKILWSAGVIETIGSLVYIICSSSYGITNIVYPSIAVCIAAALHMLVTLFMCEKLNFSEKLSKISLYFISVFVTVSLFIQATQRTTLHGIPFLFVYTCLMILVRRYTRNKNLNHLISMLIAAEMAYVCFYGYSALSNVLVSVLYMVILGAVVLLHWFGQSGESRQRRFTLFKLTEFLWICASIIPINVSEFSDISLPLIISEFSLIGIITYFCRYAGDDEPILKIVVKIEALASIFAGCIALCFAGNGSLGDILIIKIIYLLMTVSLLIVYSYEYATSNSTVLQMVSAGAVSAYISAFCIGYGDKFAIAHVFREDLACMPFFFIMAVIAFAIYIFNRNVKLSIALMVPLGVDMMFMMMNGYEYLADAVKFSEEFVKFNIGFIGIIHFIAVSVMVYFLWHTQPKTEDRKLYVTALKGILYYWSMFAIASLCSAVGVKEFYGSGYPFSLALVFIIIINAAAIWFGYGKDRTLGRENVRNSGFEKAIHITAMIVLYISMIYIGRRIPTGNYEINYAPLEYSIRFAQIITALGLFYVLAKHLLKNQNIIYHLAVCITATIFINCVCRGIAALSNIIYIYSIVSMVVALVCIVAGFISKSKGMRMYGLILIMLCVIKLVTIDISSENSMSRVLAFVVGGIVCFIISGIYNVFERKFIEQGGQSEVIE